MKRRGKHEVTTAQLCFSKCYIRMGTLQFRYMFKRLLSNAFEMKEYDHRRTSEVI